MPAMNDRGLVSAERTGFANISKGGGKKYGATNKKPHAAPHLVQPQSFITHKLSPDDTIQRVALRYGVTPEVIKRANNLFTNDSIHLKTSLKIPAPTGSEGAAGIPPTQSDDALVRFLNPASPLSPTSPSPEPSHSEDANQSPSIGAGVPPISSFDAIIPGLSLPPPKRSSPQPRMPPSESMPESLAGLAALPKQNKSLSDFPSEDGQSFSSFLDKIDSSLSKSRQAVKGFEERKQQFDGDADDESHSYQAGSSFHYYPHGRSFSGYHRHQPVRRSESPELVIKSGVRLHRGGGGVVVEGAEGRGVARRVGEYADLEDEEDVIFQL